MVRRGLKLRKLVLTAFLPLLRRLPHRLASNLVAGVGRTEYVLLTGVRRRVDTAVTHGSHHFGRSWNIREIGRELAGNQIRWRARDQLLDGLSDRRASRLFSVSGREYLDAALEMKKGVVLLCNHFGSHMMPAHWLMREKYAYRLFMERPRHISKLLSKQFDSGGPMGQQKLFISRRATPAEAAGSILRASRVLKDGMVLMIAGDVRWSGPQTTPGTFLGQSYTFSNTWAKLAAMTSAPIVPVFCRIDQDGSYHLEFQESYNLPRGNPESDQLEIWVQDYLNRIESQVENYPENSGEYFFWSDTIGKAEPRKPARV